MKSYKHKDEDPKKLKPTGLHITGDEDKEHCYAPIENGKLNLAKKRHFDDGVVPEGWVMVDCDY